MVEVSRCLSLQFTMNVRDPRRVWRGFRVVEGRSKGQVRDHLSECIKQCADFRGVWNPRVKLFVVWDMQMRMWSNGVFNKHVFKHRRGRMVVEGQRMIDGCPLRTVLYNAYIAHGYTRVANGRRLNVRYGNVAAVVGCLCHGQWAVS